MAKKRRLKEGPKRLAEKDWDDLSPEGIRTLWERWRAAQPEDICLHCINMVWPKRRTGWHMPGRVLYPLCVDHVDSPGVPREVHPAETCPNFRPRPRPPERGMPPEPTEPGIRYIPLTRSLWATVDAADFDRLNRHRWYASASTGGKMYARRNTKNGTILMHRAVVEAPAGMVVDHKNRNTLDNRRSNLRVCTAAQNEYNKGPRGKRSKYKGVYPDGNKWYAMLKHEGVTHYLGTFDDEVEAARARDRKAHELEGEFAYLNFPEDFPPPSCDRATPDR